MSSLIPMAIGIGQQDAQNPGINYNQFASQLSALDPIGNQVTKIGGDPLNLYGNKNNPNALFFPSQNPNGTSGGLPAVLPALPGVGGPQIYNPDSFSGYAKLGSDPYDQWAAQMAGKAYDPRLAQQQSAARTAVSTAPGGGKGGGHGSGVSGNGGSGSTGSPFLNLTWAPDTWTGAPTAIHGTLYGWYNNGPVSSMGIIPEGGGLTNSTVFQSMTPGGKAQR